jgi:hypothetical protein
MSLEKSVLHGKEHRKPYYRSERFDWSCRPHGRCGYCYDRRMHKHRRQKLAADQKFADFQENCLTKIRYNQ